MDLEAQTLTRESQGASVEELEGLRQEVGPPGSTLDGGNADEPRPFHMRETKEEWWVLNTGRSVWCVVQLDAARAKVEELNDMLQRSHSKMFEATTMRNTMKRLLLEIFKEFEPCKIYVRYVRTTYTYSPCMTSLYGLRKERLIVPICAQW
jgi:hypothetical protein